MLSRSKLTLIGLLCAIIPSPNFTLSETATKHSLAHIVPLVIGDSSHVIFPVSSNDLCSTLIDTNGDNACVSSKRVFFAGGHTQVSKSHSYLRLVLSSSMEKLTNGTKRLMNWYLTHLESHPVITMSISAAIISGIGDILSQILESLLMSNDISFDYRRIFAVSIECIVVSGPVMHYAYEFMEKMIPIEDVEGIWSWVATLAQVVIDTLILDSFFVFSAIVFSGIFEGLSLKNDVVPQIQDDFFPSLKASWCSSLLLSPLQLMAFRYFSVSFRDRKSVV